MRQNCVGLAFAQTAAAKRRQMDHESRTQSISKPKNHLGRRIERLFLRAVPSPTLCAAGQGSLRQLGRRVSSSDGQSSPWSTPLHPSVWSCLQGS